MQKIEGETYRSTKAGPGWWAGCLVKSHDPMIDPSLVLQRRYEEKGELSSLEGSSNCSFTVDHHQAENAPFPPGAEMLTAQPCQRVAGKVSSFPDPALGNKCELTRTFELPGAWPNTRKNGEAGAMWYSVAQQDHPRAIAEWRREVYKDIEVRYGSVRIWRRRNLCSDVWNWCRIPGGPGESGIPFRPSSD